MDKIIVIVKWIKLREQLKDIQRQKARAKSEIFSGLKTFALFLIYWAIEKFLLDYDKLYAEMPNFKYLFYVSLAIGILGLINCFWGVFNYFYAGEKIKQIQPQVEELERELMDE
jgi:hypothetical protein